MLVLLSGCASLPSPKQSDSSAIVGELMVEFDKNWRIFRSGLHKNQLEVRLENLDSGRVMKSLTNSDGIYSFANIPPGYYAISSWEIDKTRNSERWIIVGNIGSNYVDLKPGELVFAHTSVGKVEVLSRTKFHFNLGANVKEPDTQKLRDYVRSENEDWISLIRD